MPVAKLSQEFYKRFGDKATDELVACMNSIESNYRAEIRDLFQAQFGRFEERLERRLSQTRQDIQAVRVELLRWTSAFWITLVLGILGLYFRG